MWTTTAPFAPVAAGGASAVPEGNGGLVKQIRSDDLGPSRTVLPTHYFSQRDDLTG
jgi:hypothetical protein